MPKNSLQNKNTETPVEKMAHQFTAWVGSPSSLIVHSIFFAFCLSLPLFGLGFDRVLLFLTTMVSLEAIYLSILIQFSVNKSRENIKKVEEDIDEIQEDVGEIQEDNDEIQGDIDEIQEDVDDIEEGEEKDSKRDYTTQKMIASIQATLESLMKDMEKLKRTPEKINNSKNTSKPT